ncbi:MAG TPA: hypothetical protein PK890_05740 [Terrimesophilobacter sp.]|nr:hypothetical protein [Terrimesophilobacter sp.]
MSDELIVGTQYTTVLTTDLEQFAQSMDVVHEELIECSARLAHVDRLVTDQVLRTVDAPYSAALAEAAQADARRSIVEALASSELLSTGLRRVIDTYESTEHALDDAHRRLAGLVGYGTGWLLPGLAFLVAPLLVPTLAGGAAGIMMLPQDQRAALIANVLASVKSKAGVLTDPATVELVRTIMSSADEAMAGAMRMPLGFAAGLGEDGLGVMGISSSAASATAAAASVGFLRESSVVVRPVSTRTDESPATGARDRIERIPHGNEQIRIDRYSIVGEPDRIEVYIAGTAELGAGISEEALDMTSNMHAMAGASAGSQRAVEEALRQAGVTADTPIVFNGYSQGGLIAARLASSGEWNATGLVTVGAPAGVVAVPRDIPYLAIEHTDDLVPALGGRFEHSEPLVVRRQFADGRVDVSEKVLPAHDLDDYVYTAGLIDDEPDTRIRDLFERLDTGGTVTSKTYRADRVLGDE